MTPTASPFARINASVWHLVGSQDRGQAGRLHSGVTFEHIVDRLIDEVSLVYYKRERAERNPKYFRIKITLQARSSTIELFHSAATGYRAQYYNNVETGERANRYLIDRIMPRVMEVIANRPKRTCKLTWVHRSLADPDAKAWIHQGLWLWHASTTDRHLLVPRWTSELESSDKDRWRKAFYSGLTPKHEDRMDLKGGFLTLFGDPLGTLKPSRARDIHELGFT